MARNFRKVHTVIQANDVQVGEMWKIEVSGSDTFDIHLNETEATQESFLMSKINHDIKQSGASLLTVGEWDDIMENLEWEEETDIIEVPEPDPDFVMPG